MRPHRGRGSITAAFGIVRSRVSGSADQPGNIRRPVCIHWTGDGERLRLGFPENERMRISAVIVALGLAAPIAAAPAASINDAQIASIVVTANQVDIDAGKAAAARTKNPEVKKFAELMVTDHTGVNKSATDLVTKLKVTPEDNDTSKALKAGGESNLSMLQGLS